MQNTSILKQNYDAKFDILKFFMSILVVAIHSKLFPKLLYPWLRIPVPMFFIISSYFLFSKLNKPNSDNKTIIKKYVLRNIKLYCFWFIILLPITLDFRRVMYFSFGFVTGITNFIKGLLFNSTFYASWYITASILGTLIIYFLSKKINRGILFIIVLTTFFFVSLRSSYYSTVAHNEIIVTMTKYYDMIFGGFVCSFPASLIWIFIGKCFAENKIKIPPSWVCAILLIISCIGLYIEWRYVIYLNGNFNNDSYFLLLPVAISLFMLMLSLKTVKYSKSKYLRHASTVIYVVHGSLTYVFRNIFELIFDFDVSVFVFISSLLVSVLIYIFIEFMLNRFPKNKIVSIMRFAY